MTIDVWQGSQKVHTVTVGNGGKMSLSAANYSPGVTYEVEVYKTSDYSSMRYDTFELPTF